MVNITLCGLGADLCVPVSRAYALGLNELFPEGAVQRQHAAPSSAERGAAVFNKQQAGCCCLFRYERQGQYEGRGPTRSWQQRSPPAVYFWGAKGQVETDTDMGTVQGGGRREGPSREAKREIFERKK